MAALNGDFTAFFLAIVAKICYRYGSNAQKLRSINIGMKGTPHDSRRL